MTLLIGSWTVGLILAVLALGVEVFQSQWRRDVLREGLIH